jgi:hypothetical protein
MIQLYNSLSDQEKLLEPLDFKNSLKGQLLELAPYSFEIFTETKVINIIAVISYFVGVKL